MKTKTKPSYLTIKWGASLAIFTTVGAPQAVCAAPSVSHAKHYGKSFIDTETLDSEDFYDEQDIETDEWQDYLTEEEETMNTSPLALSHNEQIVEARFVPDESTFLETGDFIPDFVAPESLLLPEIWGGYEVVVPLEMDDEDDLIPLDMDSTDLEIFNV